MLTRAQPLGSRARSQCRMRLVMVFWSSTARARLRTCSRVLRRVGEDGRLIQRRRRRRRLELEAAGALRLLQLGAVGALLLAVLLAVLLQGLRRLAATTRGVLGEGGGALLAHGAGVVGGEDEAAAVALQGWPQRLQLAGLRRRRLALETQQRLSLRPTWAKWGESARERLLRRLRRRGGMLTALVMMRRAGLLPLRLRRSRGGAGGLLQWLMPPLLLFLSLRQRRPVA